MGWQQLIFTLTGPAWVTQNVELIRDVTSVHGVEDCQHNARVYLKPLKWWLTHVRPAHIALAV